MPDFEKEIEELPSEGLERGEELGSIGRRGIRESHQPVSRKIRAAEVARTVKEFKDYTDAFDILSSLVGKEAQVSITKLNPESNLFAVIPSLANVTLNIRDENSIFEDLNILFKRISKTKGAGTGLYKIRVFPKDYQHGPGIFEFHQEIAVPEEEEEKKPTSDTLEIVRQLGDLLRESNQKTSDIVIKMNEVNMKRDQDNLKRDMEFKLLIEKATATKGQDGTNVMIAGLLTVLGDVIKNQNQGAPRENPLVDSMMKSMAAMVDSVASKREPPQNQLEVFNQATTMLKELFTLGKTVGVVPSPTPVVTPAPVATPADSEPKGKFDVLLEKIFNNAAPKIGDAVGEFATGFIKQQAGKIPTMGQPATQIQPTQNPLQPVQQPPAQTFGKVSEEYNVTTIKGLIQLMSMGKDAQFCADWLKSNSTPVFLKQIQATGLDGVKQMVAMFYPEFYGSQYEMLVVDMFNILFAEPEGEVEVELEPEVAEPAKEEVAEPEVIKEKVAEPEKEKVIEPKVIEEKSVALEEIIGTELVEPAKEKVVEPEVKEKKPVVKAKLITPSDDEEPPEETEIVEKGLKTIPEENMK